MPVWKNTDAYNGNILPKITCDFKLFELNLCNNISIISYDIFATLPIKKSVTSYEKGVRAEDIASEYLSSKMYDVLARRVKTRYGEIDLICRNENAIVVVEVKYRSTSNVLYECISDRQRQRISRALLCIVSDYPAEEYRVDVVYICNGAIEHVENAFYIENYITY